MAVNMITSGFLLLVLVAGVQSSMKELGEACDTATPDSCVSPLAVLVCDTPPTKTKGFCRVKSGQSCKNAGGLCVVGATCDSGTGKCACATGYSTVTASGQCTPPDTGYYDTCADATTDCALTGVDKASGACSTDGGCKCVAATPVPIYTDGTCIAWTAVAAGKVGQACGAGAGALGCGTAATTHLTCDSNSLCQCDPGYFPTKAGGDCVDNTAVSSTGKGCSTNADCKAANNEICNSASPKVCACDSGFTGKPGGACFPIKGSLKGGCSVDGDCTVTAGATNCTSVASAPKTCKTQVTTAGGNCTDTTSTLCGGGLTCNNNMCTQSNANSVTITAFLVMAVALVGKLMM